VEGGVDVRVVASTPGTAGLYRLDSLVASLATKTLWLTDAYFAGTSSYIQSMRAASRDGVDVRLLVPGPGSDVPLMRSVSRAGYRVLLQAGIRVFEWNGPMLHAKTAVADARWARVGSTNLNLSSWMGNRELDVVVEDEAFGGLMEQMFREDLRGSTEIVLQGRSRVRPAEDVGPHPRRLGGAQGSATRAAASALRIGNALGSVLAARRVHVPAERLLMSEGGLILVACAVVALVWPRLLAWPLAAIGLWLGLALLLRASRAVGSRSGAAASSSASLAAGGREKRRHEHVVRIPDYASAGDHHEQSSEGRVEVGAAGDGARAGDRSPAVP